MSEVRVRYKGTDTAGLTVRLIKTWLRDGPEMTGLPILSTSGGPKEMMKNDVWGIFHRDAAIDAVSMVRAGASPFYIIRKGTQYFDVTNKEVELSQKRTAQTAAQPAPDIRRADIA
jgi:hypothetical protein